MHCFETGAVIQRACTPRDAFTQGWLATVQSSQTELVACRSIIHRVWVRVENILVDDIQWRHSRCDTAQVDKLRRQ